MHQTHPTHHATRPALRRQDEDETRPVRAARSLRGRGHAAALALAVALAGAAFTPTVAEARGGCTSDAACPSDACNTGYCQHFGNKPGVCKKKPRPIDDGNSCTSDRCNLVSGITHRAKAAGSRCNDGNACTRHDACDGAGHCKPGLLVPVDDGDPCTADACATDTGQVTHTPIPQCAASGTDFRPQGVPLPIVVTSRTWGDADGFAYTTPLGTPGFKSEYPAKLSVHAQARSLALHLNRAAGLADEDPAGFRVQCVPDATGTPCPADAPVFQGTAAIWFGFAEELANRPAIAALLPASYAVSASVPFAERQRYVLHGDGSSFYVIGATPRATDPAMWGLLHELGYRHFMPGDAWEVEGKLPATVGVDIDTKPTFARFHFIMLPDPSSGTIGKEWLRHNRVGHGSVYAPVEQHGYTPPVACSGGYEVEAPENRAWFRADAIQHLIDFPYEDTASLAFNDAFKVCCNGAECAKPTDAYLGLASYVADELEKCSATECTWKQDTSRDGRRWVLAPLYNNTRFAPSPGLPVHPNVMVQVNTVYADADTLPAVEALPLAPDQIVGIYAYSYFQARTTLGGRLATDLYPQHARSYVESLDVYRKAPYAGRVRLITQETALRDPVMQAGHLAGTFDYLWTGDASRTDAVTADFFARAFPEAQSRSAMQAFYADAETLLPLRSRDTFGRLYRRLQQAKAALDAGCTDALCGAPGTRERANVEGRLRSVVLWVRGQELMHRTRGKQLSPVQEGRLQDECDPGLDGIAELSAFWGRLGGFDKATAIADDYAASAYANRFLLAATTYEERFTSCCKAPACDPSSFPASSTPFTDAEVDAILAAGATLPLTVAPTSGSLALPSYAEDLVPVPAGTPTAPGGVPAGQDVYGEWDPTRTLVRFDGAARVLPLYYNPDPGGYRVSVEGLGSAGWQPLLSLGSAPASSGNYAEIPISASALSPYTLVRLTAASGELEKQNGGFRFATDTGAHQVLDLRGLSLEDVATVELFVPSTNQQLIAYNLIDTCFVTPGGGGIRVTHGNGTIDPMVQDCGTSPVTVEGHVNDYVTIPVPPGQGGVWRATIKGWSFKAREAHTTFVNVPPYGAPVSGQLVVPSECLTPAGCAR